MINIKELYLKSREIIEIQGFHSLESREFVEMGWYELCLPIFISRLRGKTRSSADYGIPGIPVMV